MLYIIREMQNVSFRQKWRYALVVQRAEGLLNLKAARAGT
jgi:hypothetical protein